MQAMLNLALKVELPHAEQCMREALAAHASVLNKDHPVLALRHLDLASILIEMHRLEEAVGLTRHVTTGMCMRP
jgi:hypothetical protein